MGNPKNPENERKKIELEHDYWVQLLQTFVFALITVGVLVVGFALQNHDFSSAVYQLIIIIIIVLFLIYSINNRLKIIRGRLDNVE